MNRRRLLLACIALGLAASGYATYVHYHLLQDPAYTSVCDVSATISCTQAYSSRFGSMAGVPVALLGLLWFVFAALVAWPAEAAPAPGTRGGGFATNAYGYLFVLATVALSFVLYLAYGAFFVLRVICPMCLMTYVAVIGIFIVSGISASFPMSTLPSRFVQDVRRVTPRAVMTVIVFGVAATSAIAFFPRETAATSGTAAASTPPPAATAAQASELERFMSGAPRVPLIIPADGAKVLVVKFNDYQCPACGQSYLGYKPIFAKYEASHPGAVKIVLKDYPLNPNCNPNLVTVVHPAACDAAVAVRLARMRGKGDAMEEWLYTHQPTMTPAAVREAAKEVGGVTNFDEMYSATLELVKADTTLGRQVGVRSTPTFFIDGVKVEGAWQPQFFDAAIAFELKRAGVTP